MNNNFKEKNVNFPNYWNWNGIKVSGRLILTNTLQFELWSKS